MSKNNEGLIAIIRIRGTMDITKEVKHGLQLLSLNKPNHACVVPNDKIHTNMLQKLKDFITWGEISKPTLQAMLEKRGRIKGNKKLDESFLKEQKFENMTAFVNALYAGKADMRRIEGLKPLFRLHPPRKGFKSVKNPVTKGGDLGYRGDKINELLDRMM